VRGERKNATIVTGSSETPAQAQAKITAAWQQFFDPSIPVTAKKNIVENYNALVPILQTQTTNPQAQSIKAKADADRKRAQHDREIGEVDANMQEGSIWPYEELLRRGPNHDYIYSLLTDTIDARFLEACAASTPRLKMVANMAVGFNNIDVEAATRLVVVGHRGGRPRRKFLRMHIGLINVGRARRIH